MSFIDTVLQAHRKELRLDTWLPHGWETIHVTPQFATSRHIIGLILGRGDNEPCLVVKIPRQPGDNAGVAREATILTALAKEGPSPVPGVPRIIGTFDAGRYTVLVETALCGEELDPARVQAAFDQAVQAGVGFVSTLPRTASPEQNQGWYQRTLGEPLAVLASIAPLNGETADLVNQTHQILTPLQAVALPAVVEHADLSHPNLLLDQTGRLQVMDWERATTTGVPGHDLIFFLQYLSESVRDAYERPSQLLALDAAFAEGGWALPHIHKYLQRIGIDERLAPHLILATWARSAATLADRLTPQTQSPASPNAQQVVAQDRDFWLWRHSLSQAGKAAHS